MKLARSVAAVTLLEIMVAMSALGAGSSACIGTLLNMNRNATLSRLRTGAGTVAQNQIDYMLSIQPYNPQKSEIPPELAIGTRTVGSATAPTVAVYTDPRTGLVNCWGWIVVDVVDTAQNLNGVDFGLRRANVTVFYSFRNKTYSITMTTMRASDI